MEIDIVLLLVILHIEVTYIQWLSVIVFGKYWYFVL